MDFEKLRKLSERNEVHLGGKGYKRTPPYYYDSLRHALGFYFNTFNTQNASYDSYAEGLSDGNVDILKRQLLDEDNTVLTIIAFERFFELFIKDLLRRTNIKLTYQSKSRLDKSAPTLDLINQIHSKVFKPKKMGNKSYTIPFRETLNRFYTLINFSKTGNSNPIVKRFTKITKNYAFLDSSDYKASMQLLNWYRDRILHNGNKLPTLWLLDYIITQRVIPLILDITETEKDKLGKSLFYFQTVTGINIIEKLADVKYKFNDLKDGRIKKEIFIKLLYIGHLKELGRANMNMNFYVTTNIMATYEYNYTDPKGRGLRFANAEKRYKDFKEIKNCLCCGAKTLVVYSISIDDIFNHDRNINIDWAKCYTCQYHLRDNVGDPNFFKLNSEKIFN